MQQECDILQYKNTTSGKMLDMLTPISSLTTRELKVFFSILLIKVIRKSIFRYKRHKLAT